MKDSVAVAAFLLLSVVAFAAAPKIEKEELQSGGEKRKVRLACALALQDKWFDRKLRPAVNDLNRLR